MLFLLYKISITMSTRKKIFDITIFKNNGKEPAMKKKVNNVAVLTPDEGFKSVLDYYGIEEKELPKAGNTKQKRKVDISLDDLL